MKRYRITLIKNLEYPSDLEFLTSPIGRFCRDIDHKKWLEADEGSVGHQLMSDFASQFPDAFQEELLEIEWQSEWLEEKDRRKFFEDFLLAQELKTLTLAPRLPRYKSFRTTKEGLRQGWDGAKWQDLEEGL